MSYTDIILKLRHGNEQEQEEAKKELREMGVDVTRLEKDEEERSD